MDESDDAAAAATADEADDAEAGVGCCGSSCDVSVGMLLKLLQRFISPNIVGDVSAAALGDEPDPDAVDPARTESAAHSAASPGETDDATPPPAAVDDNRDDDDDGEPPSPVAVWTPPDCRFSSSSVDFI